MLPVVDFIDDQKPQVKEILAFVHDFMMQHEGVHSKIRYRIPFYFRNSWICYTNPRKNNTVEIVFLRANEYQIDLSKLDRTNRKQVAGVTITNLDSVPEWLDEVFEEAFRIDDLHKYKSKRSKK